MSDEWNKLSKDERRVFRDPYFFALANLPDYANQDLEDHTTEVSGEDKTGVNVQEFDTTTRAPQVYKLTDEAKEKYQPIFNRLVNVEKVHMCHGKPEPSPSVATLQKKSLVAVKKAHHNVRLRICHT